MRVGILLSILFPILSRLMVVGLVEALLPMDRGVEVVVLQVLDLLEMMLLEGMVEAHLEVLVVLVLVPLLHSEEEPGEAMLPVLEVNQLTAEEEEEEEVLDRVVDMQEIQLTEVVGVAADQILLVETEEHHALVVTEVLEETVLIMEQQELNPVVEVGVQKVETAELVQTGKLE